MPPAPPIPRLMPPLSPRGPTFIWIPVALVLAIGWPWAMLRGEGALADFALIAGAATFAIGLVSLGSTWAAKRPPRTRRTVMVHFIFAGALVSLLAPFVFTSVMQLVAGQDGAAPSSALSLRTSLAMAPLALLVGLPVSLFSAGVFALVAFVKPPRATPPAPTAREMFP